MRTLIIESDCEKDLRELADTIYGQIAVYGTGWLLNQDCQPQGAIPPEAKIKITVRFNRNPDGTWSLTITVQKV